MLKTFEITAPLPPRGSAAALRQQLVDHILRIKPVVGERFLSDHELSRIARLSRPTVRRALDDLEREGWIERRPGIGTFIGPRAGLTIPIRQHDPTGSLRQAVRVALLIHMLGDFGHDWYASGVMAGIDQAAEETGVSLELLGNRDGDVKSVSRRLLQSRPDVLAFCAPPLKHTVLMGEAHRLDIPCIGTGTLLATIGIPTVCEDGIDASRQAVRHLASQGHKRIGFVMGTFALPWVFHRRQGYMNGMKEAGLEPDEGMVCWLDRDTEANCAARFEDFLQRRQPTAVLFGSWVLVPCLAYLIQRNRLTVPKDLSVITFDQHPNVSTWLNCQPTCLKMPLVEMGKRLARMAQEVTSGRTLEPITELPCELVIGDSVRAI